MHEYVVIGPIDGLFHLAYRIAGTKNFSSVQQFSSEKAASNVCGELNQRKNAANQQKNEVSQWRG